MKKTTKKPKSLLNNNMGNLVRTQVETKEGEILLTITLNLNVKLDADDLNLKIKLESDGKVRTNQDVVSEDKTSDMNKVVFEKPDICENSEIIDFGKEV